MGKRGAQERSKPVAQIMVSILWVVVVLDGFLEEEEVRPERVKAETLPQITTQLGRQRASR